MHKSFDLSKEEAHLLDQDQWGAGNGAPNCGDSG
jgi:hypothetical protein